MRASLGKALEGTDITALHEDPYSIIRIVMRLASTRWQTVIRDQEAYTLPNLKSQYLGVIDERLLEKESFGEYLKQTFGMLQMNLQIFQTLKSKSPAFAQENDELLTDYEFLVDKVKAQIEHNSASIPVITAMIAVEESRKAMQQANDVK
jgi:thiaminase